MKKIQLHPRLFGKKAYALKATALVLAILPSFATALAATPLVPTTPAVGARRTAVVYRLEEPRVKAGKPLFTYQGSEKVEGKDRLIFADFKDQNGEPAYHQALRYRLRSGNASADRSRLELVSFELVNHHSGLTYRITAKDGKIRYEKREKPGAAFVVEGSEAYLPIHFVGPLLPLRIEEVFPLLLKKWQSGERDFEVRVKIPVPEQVDSFTFMLALKDPGAAGKHAVIRMRPNSPFVALVVKPIEFDLDPKSGFIAGTRGRMFLQLRKVDTDGSVEFEPFPADMRFR